MKRPSGPDSDRPGAAPEQPGSVAADDGQSDAWGRPGASSGEREADPLTISESVRYERGLELGRGGMGRVLAARDRRLGRQVALKEVRPGADPRRAAAKLAAEAQLAAGLDHPGIVTIHDAGRDARGQPFYAMRLVRGRTLTQAAHALPTPSERLRLVQPLLAACHAIAHAHERHIVHRDLKPDNLLVGPHGETQVVDWGLACTLTQAAAGGAVGTEGYMAPEVAAGEPASPRSDVYSLGATLVQVLSVEPTESALARRAAALPPELRAIAERCLESDPLRRYPDAGALAEDLSAWQDGRRVAAHSYSVGELAYRLLRAIRIPLIVGSVGLLLIAVVAWQGYRRTVNQRDRAITAEHTARVAQSDSEKHLAAAYVQAAESAEAAGAHAEAETLAAAAIALEASPAGRGILARVAEGPEATLLSDAPLPNCRRLRFAPDGKWLLCVKDDEVQLLSGDDGRLVWRRPGVFEDGVINSYAGRVFLSTLFYRGSIVDLTTGATLIDDLTIYWLRGHVVQRDSPWIAVQNHSFAHLLNVATGVSYQSPALCPPSDKITAVGFAPAPGTVLVSCLSGRISRYSFEAPAPEPLVDLKLVSPSGVSALAVKSDGTIFAGTLDGRLLVGGRELRDWSGGAHRLQPGVLSLSAGPEGSLAALAEGLGPIVWSRHASQAVHLPVRDRIALAFVDSSTVAVAGERLRRYALRTPAHPARFGGSGGISQAALSPDGKWLAAGDGDGSVTIWDTRGGAIALRRKLGDGVVKSVAFSPDGERLAIGMAERPGFALLRVGSWESLAAPGSPSVKRLGYFANGLLWRNTYTRGFDLIDAQGVVSTSDSVLLSSGLQNAETNHARTALLLASYLGDLLLVDQRDPLTYKFLLRLPWVVAVALSSDARLVAIAEADRIRLFDVASRRFVGGFSDPGQRINTIAFSPDDTLLYVAELERTVRVFRVADGVELAVLRGHSQRVSDLVFGPATMGLLSASWDGTIVRWNLDRLVAPATGLPDTVAHRWGIGVNEALRYPIR